MERLGPTHYRDRTHAGQELARHVAQWSLLQPIVVGVPRGGVIVAAEIALVLHAPLDVVVVRKIGAPRNPELAIGAITATGQIQLDQSLIDRLGIPQTLLTPLIAEQQELARQRTRQYAHLLPDLDYTDRTVLLVDDGLATGTTMCLAADLIRQRAPDRLIAVVPVGSRTAVDLITAHTDAVFCPLSPPEFRSVGEYYADFGEVSDEMVVAVLKESSKGDSG